MESVPALIRAPAFRGHAGSLVVVLQVRPQPLEEHPELAGMLLLAQCLQPLAQRQKLRRVGGVATQVDVQTLEQTAAG